MFLHYIHRGKLSEGLEQIKIENRMRWGFSGLIFFSMKKYKGRWVILVYLGE